MRKLLLIFALITLLFASCTSKTETLEPIVEQKPTIQETKYWISFQVFCTQEKPVLCKVSLYKNGQSMEDGGTLPTGWYGGHFIVKYTDYVRIILKDYQNNILYDRESLNPWDPNVKSFFVTNTDDLYKKGVRITLSICPK